MRKASTGMKTTRQGIAIAYLGLGRSRRCHFIRDTDWRLLLQIKHQDPSVAGPASLSSSDNDLGDPFNVICWNHGLDPEHRLKIRGIFSSAIDFSGAGLAVIHDLANDEPLHVLAPERGHDIIQLMRPNKSNYEFHRLSHK